MTPRWDPTLTRAGPPPQAIAVEAFSAWRRLVRESRSLGRFEQRLEHAHRHSLTELVFVRYGPCLVHLSPSMAFHGLL